MRKTTDTVYWAGGAALTLLTGGLLLLPLGLLLALFQRIKEIQKGEEDDAKNY